MHTADDIPGFSGSERLGLSVFGSVLAHLIIVLGITFTVPRLPDMLDELPTLEITLVQSQSEEAPEEADFLAQANQEGGGDSEEPLMAKSPVPVQELTVTQPEVPRAAPPPRPELPQATPRPEILTKTDSARPDLTPPPPKTADPTPRSRQPNPGVVLDPQAAERARLTAELSRSWEEYQKRPRRTFLTARTREYKYASYMEAWRAKVERVGNINYPEEAKSKGLTGALVLDVALNPDGSINDITVQRPSGFQVLDDAAIRIVRLAAPYAPFPDNIRADTDILHITRTWQFLQGNRLTSH